MTRCAPSGPANAGAKRVAESYPTRRLAEARDSDLRDLRWQGKLDEADAGAEPLYDAADAWRPDHVEPNVARSTILSYVHVLDLVCCRASARRRSVTSARRESSRCSANCATLVSLMVSRAAAGRGDGARVGARRGAHAARRAGEQR